MENRAIAPDQLARVYGGSMGERVWNLSLPTPKASGTVVVEAVAR
jgi:hypothetical protein